MSRDETVPLGSTSRRALLGGLVVGAAALAGCTGTSGGDDGDESTPRGTESVPARLRLEEIPSPDCETPDPIVFADLPAEEQDLVETALERDEYTVAHRGDVAGLRLLPRAGRGPG